MVKIVSIHSFRGGTGKSNLIANLATSLALQGKRVGIVDTDIQSPGVHVLFGLDVEKVSHTLNDYLWGRCSIEAAVFDVGQALDARFPQGPSGPGGVFLIPSSMKMNEITAVLSEGYDVGLLTTAYEQLSKHLKLDFLMVDTHPGINEETLFSIGISDTLLLVLRPDYQDYQGTAVAVKVAKQLDVPKMMLVMNKVLADIDVEHLREQMENIYQIPVAAVLPACDEMMRIGSRGIFCLTYPNHPLTRAVHNIVSQIINS